jgi:23S rRNA (guanosine2251-2'-O)-methyltransferase
MFQSKEDKNHNPRRHVKQARQPMIIGIRPLIEAMLAGKEIDKVLVQQGLKGDLYAELKELLGEHKVPQQIVPVEKLNRITRSNHQGIIAFVSPISYGNLENMIAQVFEDGETPLFLLLDGITDVRNLGSICRSAECLGAQAIIVPEKGSAQINEEAIKTSAGALHHLPVCRIKSIAETVQLLQQSGIKVVGCTEKTNLAIEDIDMTTPTCIAMGAEDLGLSDAVLRKADQLALIPMKGKTSSLNVAVSAGIILHEASRQRRLIFK